MKARSRPVPRITAQRSERFWSLVRISLHGCWDWRGGVSGNGYPQFDVEGRAYAAHRIAYTECVGPIPNGLVVDHVCRNILCVNPAHLEAVTIAENVRRGRNHYRELTHCPQGHEYTNDNTYVFRGGRQCRTCSRLYKLRYKQRKREERRG